MMATELPLGWPTEIPSDKKKFFTVMVDDFQSNLRNRMADFKSMGIRFGVCAALQYLTTDDGSAYVVPSYTSGGQRRTPQDAANINKIFKWSDLEAMQADGCEIAYHGYAHPFDSLGASTIPPDFEQFKSLVQAHNSTSFHPLKVTGYIGPNGVDIPLDMMQQFCWSRPGRGGYVRAYGKSRFGNILVCFENGFWLDGAQYSQSLADINALLDAGTVQDGQCINLNFHTWTTESDTAWNNIKAVFTLLQNSGFYCITPMRAVRQSLCYSGNLGANSPIAIAGAITQPSYVALHGGYDVFDKAGTERKYGTVDETQEPLWNWWDTGTPATTYTATFVADGRAVDTVEFEAGATVLPRVPTVPAKTGYTGAWEPYTLADADITINAVYTPIQPDAIAYDINGDEIYNAYDINGASIAKLYDINGESLV